MPPPLVFLFAKPQVAQVSLNKETFPTNAGFTNIRFRKVAPNLQTELPNKIKSKDSLYFSLDQNLFANMNGRAFFPVVRFLICLQLYVQKAIPFSTCSNYFTKIIISCIYPRSTCARQSCIYFSSTTDFSLNHHFHLHKALLCIVLTFIEEQSIYAMASKHGIIPDQINQYKDI